LRARLARPANISLDP